MKKTFSLFLVFALAISLSYGIVFAQNLVQGNGAPSGAHYNLNLLGKKTCPGDDLTDSNRHTIMVLLDYSDDNPDSTLGDDSGNIVTLDKHNKIFLGAGDDFQVTDGNACDKNGASFTLPSNIATDWNIYVRELGKPGGKGVMTTCGISDNGTPDDPSDDEVVCSTNNVQLERKKGKSVFRNVTTELTTVDYYTTVVNTDGSTTTVEDTALLFDPDFYQYFWDYDNNGLRLVQLRFYPAAN